MSSKLPIRKNVEPLFKLVSDLDKPSNKSSSLEQCTRTDAEYDPGPKSDHHYRLARKNRKSRLAGSSRTYVGKFVSRSKSVDDLQAGNERASKDRKSDHEKRVESELRAKDHQISKLIKKITTLFECNNEFAIQNDKLQKEYQQVQQNLRALESIQPKSCENCAAHEIERTTFLKEHDDLKNDLRMMKILVYRLNVQVERYQDVIRNCKGPASEIPKIDFVDSSYGGTKDNLNWGPVNSHTLGPLLNAYEETIVEKNDLIQQFEREMIDFTGKLKKVMEENEKLHGEMENIKSTQSNWFSERAKMQAQIDVFKSKAEVQGKRADLAKEKLIEVLKCYEQKIQAQCLDIERLQEAYSRSKGELASLRHLSHKPEVEDENLKECQRLFDELKIQHVTEKSRITVEIDTLRNEVQAKNEEIVQLRSQAAEQKAIFDRQKEINEVLVEKNTSLKQSLERIRQSKEVLKTRLKKMITWSKSVEQRRDQWQDSWRSVKALQDKVRQRDEQLQALQAQYRSEVDQLQRRLRHREDTLRNVLGEKAQFRQV
ncbi:protein Cep89 homolog [Toxorhynchites rutilus septentrionalis]|uniref:protein Cep89 homolog n=1 Tax=Toxorhynchites rutilus septentrionalis TaxID=329112 RepID=UPI00247A30C6|nr:protein Cep89 homolog [Toxorhynchites rutilus septentrionalis]XP_055625704.1 protein Cep89 homolog [Toxorhynchites rutilus septentrionalis]